MGLYYDIALIFSFQNVFPEQTEIQAIGEIINVKEKETDGNQYEVRILDNQAIPKSNGKKVIVYMSKDSHVDVGDKIDFYGIFKKASTARNYKGFNYQNYLKQSKIYGIVTVKQVKKIGTSFTVTAIIGKIKNKLYHTIKEMYEGQYANFLNGILIGYTSEIDEEIKNDFRDSSVSHILAISGMHISYMLLGLNFVFCKIMADKKVRNFCLIGCLLFFCAITGFSSSCVRACIMNSCILIASNTYRKNDFFRSLFLSFMIIILLNPYHIFSVGMWLSFAGTIGIVLFHSFLYHLFLLIIPKKIVGKKKKNDENKKHRCLQSICVSLSAQIFIFPIMLYSFNTLSLSFLISNVAISFFIGPILALGYVSILYSIICQFILTVSTNIFSKNAIVVIIFSKCFSYIAYVMRAIETIGIKIVFAIAKICAKLPFSKIYFTTPKFVLILLYYGILLGIVWYVRKYTLRIFIFLFRINRKKHEKSIIYSKDKKKYHKRKISNIHKSINNISTNISINRSIYKNISRIIIVIGIGTIGLCTWLHFHETLMIYFVDVGQGDCTVITTPKGKNIVIDGGEGNSDQYDYGKNVVVPYLLDRGIKQIDYLIVSHCDSDHIGGLLAVLKTLKVEKIFIGKQPENSKQLQDMLAVAHQKNIEIISLEANMHVNIEKDMYIHVLWPNSSNMITENALNNNSLVFKLCYQNISCMFTGDIEEIAEKEILRTYQNQPTILKAEILKVAHHGSKTSTTNDFLYTVQPKVALIGVGERQSIWTSFKRSNRQIAYAKNKDISHRYNGRNHFVHSGTLVNGTFCPFYYVC